jgi:ABC-type transporter Mla MlaB component
VQPSGYTLWEAPGQLDLPALQSLLDQTRNTDLPLHLNWQRLTAISAEAAQGLGALFSEWCAKSVRLHFAASDVLEKVLKSMTPSGDRQVEVAWWKLRLNVLRMLRLQDEFELVALDFCVTYEVSPPPWVDPRCECGQGSTHGAVLSARMPPLFNDVETGDPVDFDHASTQLMSIDSIPASVVELSGEVLGDALEAMDKLQVGLTGSNRLVISCSRLIRVDFSAAGSILNWVAVRQSDGCHVQFRDVPSLVAAFFNVIGINEHARVISRTH